MLDEPPPVARTFPLRWALLFLIAGLLLGWLIGQLPARSPRAPAVAASQGTPAVPPSDAPQGTTMIPPPAESPPAQGTSPEGAHTESWGAEPAPAVAEQPTQEPQSAEVSQWTTLESAMEESRRNGKPILIDFNADWCGPCQRMKQQVFDDWTRGRMVRSAVIPVSIVDRRREEGRNPSEIESLQQRFEVDAFPTLVVFSPQTGRGMRTKGYGGADETVSWITEAAKAVR